MKQAVPFIVAVLLCGFAYGLMGGPQGGISHLASALAVPLLLLFAGANAVLMFVNDDLGDAFPQTPLKQVGFAAISTIAAMVPFTAGFIGSGLIVGLVLSTHG